MDALNSVEGSQLGSAKAVDNLGPKFPPVFSCFCRRGNPFNRLAGIRRLNRNSPSLELRLLIACGKERTGFPQVGGRFLSEIRYPVVPKIWKRCCTLNLPLMRSDKCDQVVRLVLDWWCCSDLGCFRAGIVSKA